MPYGFSDREWLAANKEAQEILAATARREKIIAYSALASQITSIRLEPDSAALAALLGEISIAEDAAGRGMLSVLVVHKTGDKQPGPGFFTLAQQLGRATRDKDACWIAELETVYAAWKQAR